MSQFIEMFGACTHNVYLSTLCNVFIDGDWIESKDQSDVGIRLIQTGNIGDGYFRDKDDKARYISEQTFEHLKCTEVFPNDILISRLPDPIGRACVIPDGIGKSITAVDCTIVRLSDKILPEFFVAYTKTPMYQRQINEVATGTTRRRVSRANLGNIKITCPSLDKQQQFVDIVNQADKSKFVGFKSQFIEMSKAWPVMKLNGHVDIIRGISYKPSDVVSSLDANSVGILRANNIANGEINTNEMVYVDQSRVSDAQRIRIGDIIVCASSGSQSLVGKAAINKNLTREYAHGAFCLLIRCNNTILPKYLNIYLQTALYRNQIESLSCGSNILNIKAGHLTSLDIPIPDIKQQSDFVTIIEQADKSKLV